MHIADMEIGISWEPTASPGGGLPIATVGAGMSAAKRKGHRPGYAVCFFGDDSSNNGTHSTRASTSPPCTGSRWSYVCENNLYGISVSQKQTPAHQGRISIRARRPTPSPGVTVDGNDVLSAVYEAVGDKAVERARRPERVPTLVECQDLPLAWPPRGRSQPGSPLPQPRKRFRGLEAESCPIPRFAAAPCVRPKNGSHLARPWIKTVEKEHRPRRLDRGGRVRQCESTSPTPDELLHGCLSTWPSEGR